MSVPDIKPGPSGPGTFKESSPVDSFDRGILQFRSVVRERLPFTFIAYRSLIPEPDDDWYYLAQKTAWFVFVIFNFVDFAMKSFSPFFVVLPVVPLILDAVWILNRCFNFSHKNHPCISPACLKSIQAIGFAAFSAIGIVFLFHKVKPIY